MLKPPMGGLTFAAPIVLPAHQPKFFGFDALACATVLKKCWLAMILAMVSCATCGTQPGVMLRQCIVGWRPYFRDARTKMIFPPRPLSSTISSPRSKDKAQMANQALNFWACFGLGGVVASDWSRTDHLRMRRCWTCRQRSA